MNVQVLVSQMEAPPSMRDWVTRRLHEVLGAAVTSVLSVAVVMSPLAKARHPEPLVRCSMVVTTAQGRRVVETRDANADAALERAMRLVSLSLFAEPVAPLAKPHDRPAPLV